MPTQRIKNRYNFISDLMYLCVYASALAIRPLLIFFSLIQIKWMCIIISFGRLLPLHFRSEKPSSYVKKCFRSFIINRTRLPRERCMDPPRKGEKEMENINQMTTCVMVKCASIDSSLFLFFNRKTTSSLHFRLYSSRSPFLSARFLFRSLNWVCSSFFIHLLIFILKFCYSIVFLLWLCVRRSPRPQMLRILIVWIWKMKIAKNLCVYVWSNKENWIDRCGVCLLCVLNKKSSIWFYCICGPRDDIVLL